jgi:RNA recognition motif-containing protein
MRDGDGASKGFGFVCFTDASSAEKATQFVMRSEITDTNGD